MNPFKHTYLHNTCSGYSPKSQIHTQLANPLLQNNLSRTQLAAYILNTLAFHRANQPNKHNESEIFDERCNTHTHTHHTHTHTYTSNRAIAILLTLTPPKVARTRRGTTYHFIFLVIMRSVRVAAADKYLRAQRHACARTRCEIRPRR